MASDLTCEPGAAALDQARCIVRAEITKWLDGPTHEASMPVMARQIPYDLVRLLEQEHLRPALRVLARSPID